jgi:hypothetical protein
MTREQHRNVSTEARLRKLEKPFDKQKKTDSSKSELLQRAVRNLDGYDSGHARQSRTSDGFPFISSHAVQAIGR